MSEFAVQSKLPEIKKRGRKKKDPSEPKKITRNNIKKYFSSTLKTKVSLDTSDDINILCIKLDQNSLEEESPQPIPIKAQEDSSILGEFSTWKPVTDIHCWNCAHIFDTVPIGLPTSFSNQDDFTVKGIFCSFACIARYTIDRNIYTKYKANIIYLFKMLTGLKETELLPAPFVSLLKNFGGKMDIDEYRTVGKTKIFKFIRYPMHISRDYIEEFDLQTIKEANDLLFKNKSSQKEKANIHDFLKKK